MSAEQVAHLNFLLSFKSSLYILTIDPYQIQNLHVFSILWVVFYFCVNAR